MVVKSEHNKKTQIDKINCNRCFEYQHKLELSSRQAKNRITPRWLTNNDILPLIKLNGWSKPVISLHLKKINQVIWLKRTTF